MTFPEQVGALRRTLHRALVRRLSGRTKRPLLQLKALWLVGRDEVRTQAQLAERLFVDPPAASRIVARLESDGLLTRTPGSDRRCVCLKRTPAGKRESKPFEDALRWLDHEVRKHAAQAELVAADQLMQRLQQELD